MTVRTLLGPITRAAEFAVLIAAATLGAAEPASRLPLVAGDYPRAFFFRQSEGLAAQQRVPYEEWEKTFGQLMGVMGKVLDEEVPGRSRGLATFVRFKHDHPGQAVLLHLNGNSRDPRYEGTRFFAGHWLYYNGATVLDDLPAQPGEVTVHVSDPRLFETGGGRYRNSNDDVGLCELGPDGRPDWTRAEQVQLLAVDRAAKTLRLRRAAFGTAPRAFAGGRVYAAAHAAEGPWGTDSHLLWNYNYATTCPRDARGRTAADIYVAHLAELFTGNGPLATFDGLEFDVLFNEPNGTRRPSRGADCDADGKRDNGIVGGLNVYGNGVTEFCRQLRAALGDGKLILADGAFRRDSEQRAMASLNGIESEGWPVLGDFKIDDWSGGLNRHAYWAAFGRSPTFNYANVKFVEPGETPGATKQAGVPFASVRLAFAGAVFTDSAITFSHRPPGGAGAVWDELVAGAAKRVGWLGRAIGPARHLSDDTPEVMAGDEGLRGEKLRAALSSDDATVSIDRAVVRIAAEQPGAREFSVNLAALPSSGAGWCMTVTARCAPLADTPAETPRIVRAMVVPPEGGKPGNEIMSWVGPAEFASRFYFRTIPPGRAVVRFRFESGEPVWISSIRIQAAPDRMVREFARGVVLANPSDAPQSFDLTQLWLGRTYRRLRGTAGQDEATNNGERAPATLILPARDAVFLIADDGRG